MVMTHRDPPEPGDGHDRPHPGDAYLFDRSGTPHADIERLERVLGPLGARADDPRPAAHPSPADDIPRAAARSPLLGRLAAAAACAAAALVVAFFVQELRAPQAVEPHLGDSQAPPAAGFAVTDPAAGGGRVAVGAWVEPSGVARELLIGDVGRVVLAAGSRLQVREVGDESTRLYLQRGSLEATVSADARPRFFQVDTDAARCVDLGCRYTLAVTDDGAATVHVTTGQVAFETADREVFIPAGALCAARRDSGPGTPRFADAPADLIAALDAFDAAPREPADRRRAAAASALDAVRGGRDTLAAWHLLQDADPEIARAADARLRSVAGACGVPSDGTPADARRAWKADLFVRCW